MSKAALSFPMLALVFLASAAPPALGQWFIDFENGLAVSGYNDVRIPNATGTLFSLSEELTTDPGYYIRVRLGYGWKSGHNVSVLAAPLTLRASGSVGREILFNGDAFAPGVPLSGRYRFNSYRATYRYDFVRGTKWRVGAGLTLKVRDAAIGLEGGGTSSEKTNVGLVPLVNFRVLWRFHRNWSLLLDGDAAAAKQGRAEDVQLALQYRLSDRLTLRAGYRVLEGGADVDEVYNFALIHFLGAGLRFEF
jgi:opacity protein-like surface antigen